MPKKMLFAVARAALPLTGAFAWKADAATWTGVGGFAACRAQLFTC